MTQSGAQKDKEMENVKEMVRDLDNAMKLSKIHSFRGRESRAHKDVICAT